MGRANPHIAMQLIAGKQKVGHEDADKIALVVLIALDAAKRSQATTGLCNTITAQLLIGIIIWTKFKDKVRYDQAVKAWSMMVKACQRPTDLLDLTTPEYLEIRLALANYLKILPALEIKTLAEASALASQELNR